MTPGAPVPMSLEEFRLLSGLALEVAGLHFDEDARERLERRLQERLKATGCRDFTDYYVRLRTAPDADAEVREMLEHCVTNETYFFRERRALAALEEEILPELAARAHKEGRRKLRVWSAGCSTGEEPYTLAILMQRAPCLRGMELEVVGTDLSQRALARARRGVYPQNSFRDVEPAVQERSFRRVPGGLAPNWEVTPEVRALVSWGRVNLWSEPDLVLLGAFDVILCRNVLIYFPRDGRTQVIESLHRRLRPGGYLILGHSENLLHVNTSFEIVSLKNDLVYRRFPGPKAPEPGRRAREVG